MMSNKVDSWYTCPLYFEADTPVVSCPEVPAAADGSILLRLTGTTVGSVVTYSCLDNKIYASGDTTSNIICESSIEDPDTAVWSGQPDRCGGQYCKYSFFFFTSHCDYVYKYLWSSTELSFLHINKTQ